MDTAEKKAQALLLAAQGKLTKEINAALGLHNTQLWEWREKDHLFATHWYRAQEQGSYMIAEQMEETARNEPNPKKAAVINNAVAFRLERQFRKLWAPSMDVNMNQTLDLSGALIEARKRSVLPGCDPAPALEAQVTDYVMLPAPGATDSESVDVPKSKDAPLIDPFS